MSHRFLKGYSAAVASLALIGAGALPCIAQQPSDQASFVEVTWMKVKQDKVAEFGDFARRVADANRRGKGDTWIAYTDFYGKDQYVLMASRRSSLDEVEPGMNKFMSALKESMGYTPERFFAESAKLVESSGSELRRIRTDLGWGAKDDRDWTTQMANAAYLIMVSIQVKPGRTLDAEKQLTMVKEAATTKGVEGAVAVSEVMFGASGTALTVVRPVPSIAGLSKYSGARGILGDEGYRTYSEMASQNYDSLNVRLMRPVPAWSNPPAAYLEANPKLWTVKPAVVTKQKPSTAATTGGQ